MDNLGKKLPLSTILGTEHSNNNLGERDDFSKVKEDTNSEPNDAESAEVNRLEAQPQSEGVESDLETENSNGNNRNKEVSVAPGK